MIFYLHFCECLLAFVSLGKQKMDHYILAHQSYISSPVSSEGSYSTIWVCGPSVFLSTNRHGSPQFYSGLGTSVWADAVFSDAEASSGGREQPYPGWCRKEQTYYANISLGKLLVFLFMAECAAYFFKKKTLYQSWQSISETAKL